MKGKMKEIYNESVEKEVGDYPFHITKYEVVVYRKTKDIKEQEYYERVNVYYSDVTRSPNPLNAGVGEYKMIHSLLFDNCTFGLVER